MNREQLEMLSKLQEVEFACIDLNLYLDTHPQDQMALMRYNTCAYQLDVLKKQYECMYGPILNFGFSQSQYPFQWIEGPWPWEIQY
ncbi:spore coat protein CotJB [Inediibacterium massiliense]|uniref:spore coat protein CotJB n=1 Tax=Inediibacterium massiliense TaxID=1658111 RepID=UPI0006B4A6A8|nr:spore coat protein CotJB [Inediibacterium massiliense]